MNVKDFIIIIETTYKLKHKDRDNWILHTGDIVINQSEWRKIKRGIK
jgi:hypothetical protein